MSIFWNSTHCIDFTMMDSKGVGICVLPQPMAYIYIYIFNIYHTTFIFDINVWVLISLLHSRGFGSFYNVHIRVSTLSLLYLFISRVKNRHGSCEMRICNFISVLANRRSWCTIIIQIDFENDFCWWLSIEQYCRSHAEKRISRRLGFEINFVIKFSHRKEASYIRLRGELCVHFTNFSCKKRRNIWNVYSTFTI